MLSSNSSSALHLELPEGSLIRNHRRGNCGKKLCSAIEGLICLFQGQLVETIVLWEKTISLCSPVKMIWWPPTFWTAVKNFFYITLNHQHPWFYLFIYDVHDKFSKKEGVTRCRSIPFYPGVCEQHEIKELPLEMYELKVQMKRNPIKERTTTKKAPPRSSEERVFSAQPCRIMFYVFSCATLRKL